MQQNILMVTAWSPISATGGVSTVIRTLVSELEPKRQVVVLVNDWNAREVKANEQALMGQTFRSYNLRLRTPWDRISSTRAAKAAAVAIISLPITLLQLRKLVKTKEIDVVHLHVASPYQYVFRVLKFLGGPPYIVTLHGGETVNFGNLSRTERALAKWVVRGADRCIAVSNWLAELAAATFSPIKGVTCIYNGVDITQLQAVANGCSPEASHSDIPSPYIVMVANITHVKAPDIAIRAWRIVAEKYPDLHLVIVGEPREMWADCQTLIRELGATERVHMIGPRPHKLALQIMKGAVGLIFPSRSEGLGYVLLEAGAIGVPVICTAIPPFLEIVTHGRNALVIEPESPAGLADAVAQLAGDEQLRSRLAKNLYEVVRQRFSAKVMAQQYASVYDDLIKLDSCPFATN